MHRVELKVVSLMCIIPRLKDVPNAPFGVESLGQSLSLEFACSWFLMHRVELKV